MDMDQETVYGTHEDSHVVMSERVQSLAGSIYQEFEKIIGRYDEDVVKDLMPLVVNVLESLDLSYTQNQELEVEVELLREDNEQLVTQYEREKQLRKTAEQKLLEAEDAGEDEKKELQSKIESLESIVRMLELKGKNASDHVYRLEEKESEMKREYTKLHERYTDLFKTHMDYMERTKILMGTAERLDNSRPRLPTMSLNSMSRSSGPVSFGFASLEGAPRSVGSPVDYPVPASPPDSTHSNTSLRNELQENLEKEETPQETPQKQRSPEKGWSESLSPASKESSPETEEAPAVVNLPAGRSHTKREQRSANTLYQELSFQDAEALGEMDDGADITVNDNFFGMGKEVENLIMENNELLATKNALNIVKDDLIIKVDELTSEQEILREDLKSLSCVKSKLQQRIQELEDELKKAREEVDKAGKANKSDDEEDVPMSQRKRFTRVEMARVLMERNQYKERFMELQEAVRWRDLVRATRNDPTLDRKSKQGIWRFFSNLFSVPERASVGSGRGAAGRPTPSLNYNASTHHVSPAGPLESMRKRSQKRASDIIDPATGEATAMKRISERREQYRQVRAHVEKDDGRLRAYGWSLPAKVPPAGPGGAAGVASAASSGSGPGTATRPSSAEPVPVPVYCRPLTETDSGTKQSLQIWCAAGVNLSGGRTRDGGSVVGTSVFYSRPSETRSEIWSEKAIALDDDKDCLIRSLQEELREGEEIERAAEEEERQLSSLVWICTSTRSMSRVTVVDANNPADVLKSFNVCPGHLLCIASVPGARENDYLTSEELPEVSPVTVDESPAETGGDDEKEKSATPATPKPSIRFVTCATGSETPGPPEQFAPPETPQVEQDDEEEEEEEAANAMREADDINPPRRLAKEVSGLVKDGLSQHPKENELVAESLERMSSVRPTMWIGAQSGDVYVHSAVSQWSRCIDSIKLKDAVLSIVHLHGRVLCALANGTVVVFLRGPDGQWDLKHHYVVELSAPPQPQSIRCMVAVHNRVWCGLRNQIHVLDPKTLQVQKVVDAHPRQESQVRQMAWLGEGVWVSIRLDSTLRLYHAHTYQHLQDVDIEPYVSKMLGTGKLGFSFARITALLISSSRLWIGTGNGVIISVPLSENAGVGNIAVSGRGPGTGPGSVVRVYGDAHSNRVMPGSFIPYCTMSQAQLSFHGHREAVKFFVSVPGSGGFSAATVPESETPIVETLSENEKAQSMLVMSGGEGYIDFRVVEDDDGIPPEPVPTHGAHPQGTHPQGCSITEQSHLIVWQVHVAH